VPVHARGADEGVGLPGAGFLRGCLSFYRRDSPK